MKNDKTGTPRFVGAQLTAETWETLATIPDASPDAAEAVLQEVGAIKAEVNDRPRELAGRAAMATWALRSPYLSLATAAFICMRDHLAGSGHSAAKAPRFQKGYLETASAAHEGIGLMCGYLANIAIVYKASRQEFAGISAQMNQQVVELGQIALRGEEFLATIAKTRVDISVHLEEELLLDGYQLPTATKARRQALLDRYELWEDHRGMLITAVTPVEQLLVEAEVRLALRANKIRSWEEEDRVPSDKLTPLLSSHWRAHVGCVALEQKGDQQEPPFAIMYRRLVATAAQPGGAFMQDLLNPDV